eukprot:3707233-Pyramimonas_sp.AAC.1
MASVFSKLSSTRALTSTSLGTRLTAFSSSTASLWRCWSHAAMTTRPTRSGLYINLTPHKSRARLPSPSLRAEPAGLRSRSRGLGSRVVPPWKPSPTSVGFFSWSARALCRHLPRRRLVKARIIQDLLRSPDSIQHVVALQEVHGTREK